MDKMITTVSEWVAPNGHKVTATNERRENNNKASWAARERFYVKTTYVCECGKMYWNNKRATKATMDAHDTVWFTQAEQDATIAYVRQTMGI